MRGGEGERGFPDTEQEPSPPPASSSPCRLKEPALGGTDSPPVPAPGAPRRQEGIRGLTGTCSRHISLIYVLAPGQTCPTCPHLGLGTPSNLHSPGRPEPQCPHQADPGS